MRTLKHSLFAILLSHSAASLATAADTLSGTEALTVEGDVSLQMQQAVDRFLLELINHPANYRPQHWSRDYASASEYNVSVTPNRDRFRRIIGVVDRREPFQDFQLVAALGEPPVVTETEQITVRSVRWPVLPGVTGEGLLLEPKGQPRFQVVAIPDADWNPEVLAGIEQGPFPTAPFARRLAESGGRVLVPQLINRDDRWSGNPQIRMLNQPHREFIYRPAFYLGRHLIGYEVQKVLSGVDYFANQQDGNAAIGVAGYGEGALIAMYSAAADQRINATLVSGYFSEREELWKEPIYRNVWGLLREFGDADIASLIAPRRLVIEAGRGIEISGPPKPRDGGRDYAATGRLESPSIEAVRAEYARAKSHYGKLGATRDLVLVESEDGHGPTGTDEALQAFLAALDPTATLEPMPDSLLPDSRENLKQDERQHRQFKELVDFNQKKYAESARARNQFWQRADRSNLTAWRASVSEYRDLFLREIVGDWPIEMVPPKPRTRLLYQTERWNGYEVVLDVTPEIWTNGILLVPHAITADERRPVVVAQHGRGGNPRQVCDPTGDHRAYHSFGARLADQGFVVYAPQNLYFGEEQYRLIQRKANPLGMSFFAPMVWQHRALTRWLSNLSFVDPERIAFYGLSYGGKSALWIPAVLEEYCLSICSGAFSDTVKKHIDAVGGNRAVFLFTGEYEHLEFDFAERFNHAEVSWLISPRPFMVEKGHRDGGLPDEWTAFEFARVRRHYVRLGIPELAEMELFDGGHEINQQGTYAFLQRHLRFSPSGSHGDSP